MRSSGERGEEAGRKGGREEGQGARGAGRDIFSVTTTTTTSMYYYDYDLH